MDTESDDLTFVRSHYLFAGMGEPEFDRLCHGIAMLSLERGQTLFERGDPAEFFYVVLTGRIELFVLSEAGDKKVVEVIGDGQSFAEAVAFMNARAYPVNAQTMAPSRLCRVSNDSYVALLKTAPDACMRLLGDVCRRLHGKIIEIEELTIQNAGHRLIHYLLSQTASDASDSAVLNLDLPRHVIASRLSMQPETLSRLLRSLVNAGIIEVDGKSVRVSSLSKLRQYH